MWTSERLLSLNASSPDEEHHHVLATQFSLRTGGHFQSRSDLVDSPLTDRGSSTCVVDLAESTLRFRWTLTARDSTRGVFASILMTLLPSLLASSGSVYYPPLARGLTDIP